MNMTTPGQLENVTQERVIRFLCDTLGYRYLGNWRNRPDNANIEDELLRDWLTRQKYRKAVIDKAIRTLQKESQDISQGLYAANKKVYDRLRYGIPAKEGLAEKKETIRLIDWENPENNDFAVAEEVAVKGGEQDKRPDLVLYVNGIALGVLELKRSTVAVEEGVRQCLGNQKSHFIAPFFSTVQLVLAGNDHQGLRYGAIETPARKFLAWKEEHDEYQADPNRPKLDNDLRCLCSKSRLLELVHDFVAFHWGRKKLPRPNQYFGVQAAREAIRRRTGGIIWHTQGSGKSLTMVWLAQWILENYPDGRVLIVTDRTELDEQIEGDFSGVGKEIHRTRSGADLLLNLQEHNPRLLCSLIQKCKGFDNVPDIDAYVVELNTSSKGFQPRGDIFVFVDECHRTQSDKLHKAMKNILPNALFIGFTGTPLLRNDKKTTLQIFGDYIHVYRYNEAVTDGVVLDLRYEARKIDQEVVGKEQIDAWFEAKTRGLSDYGKNKLKQRWATLNKIFSSRERLERIAADIMLDFETKPRLSSGRGNALLVSGSIYQACRFYEIFRSSGFTKCAIITSYEPDPSKLKGEEPGEGVTEALMKNDVYKKMLDGQDVETFEREVKRKFIDEPGQMQLLIVVDKLLTGFDAPPATYLYIDKQMQDHGLFQAICRVNRLEDKRDDDEESDQNASDKEYGHIIDYKDLFRSLQSAIADYTAEAFDGYDKEDVDGVLTDRLKAGKKRLDTALEQIRALCEPVSPPKGTMQYLQFFCHNEGDEEQAIKDKKARRLALYSYTSALANAFADIANEMNAAGYSDKETASILAEIERFENIRQEVKILSGDYVDLKTYEPGMRHLLDNYIRAGMSEKISAFDDLSLVDMLADDPQKMIDSLPEGIRSNHEAVAETIESNMRKVIAAKQPTNPIYFEKMSKLLDDLIRQHKGKMDKYKELLQKYAELARQIVCPESSGAYPKQINTQAKQALYGNLNKNADLALQIHEAVRKEKPDNWRATKTKRLTVQRIIEKYIQNNGTLSDAIYKIIDNNKDVF